MKNEQILFLSDDENSLKFLEDRLVLLRASDKIRHEAYANALGILQNTNFGVVFIEEIEDREGLENLVKMLKIQAPSSVLVLLAKSKDEELILSLYDAGIDEYIFRSAPPYEILVKVINAMKLAGERRNYERSSDLLVNLGAKSISSGFYTEKFANELMAEELDRSEGESRFFMMLACDELDRAKFNFEKFTVAVKNSIRVEDFVVELESGKFYIFLKSSDVSGAVNVFEKIKAGLEDAFRIKAGICEVSAMSFSELEQKASASLTDAMLGSNDYSIYQEKEAPTEEDWLLDVEKDDKKDFKLFSKIYKKKLENIITPIFYRAQNTYDGVLPETKIEQSTDENQCIFHLKSPKQTSRLTLIYPGLAKVAIYITHSGLESPENKEILMPLKSLSAKILSEILEDFIKEYQACVEEKE